ncbi:hypothetical protein F5Y10DRAFT_255285 [Nemania abortiva]|nr:hypothetical protein F5Y10DRAFT_255285 [Nemania abortiva]
MSSFAFCFSWCPGLAFRPKPAKMSVAFPTTYRTRDHDACFVCVLKVILLKVSLRALGGSVALPVDGCLNGCT